MPSTSASLITHHFLSSFSTFFFFTVHVIIHLLICAFAFAFLNVITMKVCLCCSPLISQCLEQYCTQIGTQIFAESTDEYHYHFNKKLSHSLLERELYSGACGFETNTKGISCNTWNNFFFKQVHLVLAKCTISKQLLKDKAIHFQAVSCKYIW